MPSRKFRKGMPRPAYEAGREPLRRACRRAGLRKIGSHTLRRAFASDLAMRWSPLKKARSVWPSGPLMVEPTRRALAQRHRVTPEVHQVRTCFCDRAVWRVGYFLHPHSPRYVTPPFGNRDAGH